MLRIRLEIQEKYIHRFHAMLRCQAALESFGIKIERECETPDLVFLQETTIRERIEEVRRFLEYPLIVYERIGCAPVNVSSAVRRFMAKPNVLAWTKETSFSDLKLNNAPMIDGRFHLTLINQGVNSQQPKVPPTQLSDGELAKVAAIFPIHMQSRYDYLRTVRTRTLRKRPMDVFYAGTMHYANKLVDDHRLRLVKELSVASVEGAIVKGNVFSQQQFQDLLTQSKIFVSPYGSGTYSWKDFEAIFAGCVLIKPKADFIAHYGFPIYEPGRFCVQCDPNFVDLGSILVEVLANLDKYSAFAADAQRTLLSACNAEQYSQDLATFFLSVQQRAAA